MTARSVDVTVVAVVAVVWTGIPRPVRTTAIAAIADPRVRMKCEARRRVRHPEQISQSAFQKTIGLPYRLGPLYNVALHPQSRTQRTPTRTSPRT
jgi:hypothetical protein